ncbi:hypothetical protein [Bradyrhizobium commune]|uniref:Uncharacterized protein n=1 Tax=Bradyrhizobium commune TaxID=83627 RepID=A0A7S9H2G5_9BRAD|nr:hypothetical protein [Bradyrhizobium commune]QPF94754.1 hypothetical protein IC761_16410 [Bradyrhizobium commune]
MMASIFFTARLPALSINQQRLRQDALLSRTKFAFCPGRLINPAAAGHTLMNASEHDEPKRLPRKQGLCQVAFALVIGALSAF